jgi:hypothetical protein
MVCKVFAKCALQAAPLDYNQYKACPIITNLHQCHLKQQEEKRF